MGGALARAVAKALGGDALLLSDIAPQKAESLARELGARAVGTEELVRTASVIVLGVKPQVAKDTLSPLKSILAERADAFFLVSMLAGTSTEQIVSYAGGAYPVVRIMPNLPAAIGAGMILYTLRDVSEQDEAFFKQAFAQAGMLDSVPESMMDAAAALTGCGPAFASLFIEALADGAVSCGVPRAKAQVYAEQMVLGTARYLIETGTHPAALKDAVCSPGGTTIAGVEAMEASAFRAAAASAVTAAFEKTKRL